MAKLIVLAALVAMATAGVVQNRPYAGYPAYSKDYRYDGYPAAYNNRGYVTPAKAGYVTPVKAGYLTPVKAAVPGRGAYNYPYAQNNFGYGYNKPGYAGVNNYNYRPAGVAAVPVKKVVDPYPYNYNDYGVNDYRVNDYRPVKKVVDPFPSRSILPARKAFGPFPAKPAADPYPYDFGVKSVFPAKKVADPYPYSYQPDYTVKKVVTAYPAYPGRKVVDNYAYPVKNVADPYYPNRAAAYPAVNKGADPYAYDPYYAGAKRVVPAKAVVTPVVKKSVPAKSKSVFGNFGFGDFGKGFGKDLFKF